MAGTSYDRVKADILEIIVAVPRGRVITHRAIGMHLKVTGTHVAATITALEDDERARVPWWRVAADGGAVGRHIRRNDQMTRLKADGVVLSGVGIVQDLNAVCVSDVAALLRGDPKQTTPPPPKSRARGIRDKPVSSV